MLLIKLLRREKTDNERRYSMGIKKGYTYVISCDQTITDVLPDKSLDIKPCPEMLNVVVKAHKVGVLRHQVPYAASRAGWFREKEDGGWYCPKCVQKWMAEQQRAMEGGDKDDDSDNGDVERRLEVVS